MSEHKAIKVVVNRHDVWRTVLTDTMPSDMPIIICNDGLYRNLHEIWKRSRNFRKFVGLLVFGKNLGRNEYNNLNAADKGRILYTDVNQFTIPYRYAVSRDNGKFRTLSLVHPLGQVQISQFYHTHSQLICEFACRSNYSIRKPKKVGTSFKFNATEPNILNGRESIMLDNAFVDRFAGSPATYFVYSGYSRLYRFFKSKDHRRLEKKFRYRLSLDVGRCFDSIYTHTITWATLSKRTAKLNRSNYSFGNSFDRVMRRVNFNETSGICIGPETSRVFAEIVLAKVDRTLELRLKDKGIELDLQYECCRYVDNYYFFANEISKLEVIQIELERCLNEFKLHLNTEKTIIATRPLYSDISKAINSANSAVQSLRASVLDEFGVPVRVRKHEAVVHQFLDEIRAAFYSSGVGFEAISNYVVGCMWHTTSKVASHDLDSGEDVCGELKECYRQFFILVLDISFWFFTIRPTLGSSTRLASMIVRIGQFLSKHDAEGKDIVKEFLFTLIYGLAKSDEFRKIGERLPIVPIELFNVMLSVEELGRGEALTAELFWYIWERCEEKNYFLIVVGLYIFRDSVEFAEKRRLLLIEAGRRLALADQFYWDSELVHLLLDLLACPFVDKVWKEAQMIESWSKLKKLSADIDDIDGKDLDLLISEFEEQYWFARWDGVTFHELIEKKMLKTVY